MRPTRMEAFSDGVIAIIITIMVLELKVPHDGSLEGIRSLWPIFLSYALSFIFVAIYWVNHHHLIHLVKSVHSTLLWLNINLLFWMSLMPFTTAYLGEHRASALSIMIYGSIQVACSFSYLLLLNCITKTDVKDPALVEMNKKMIVKNHIAIAIFVLSILLATVVKPVAVALLLLPSIMYFIPDRHVEKHVSAK